MTNDAVSVTGADRKLVASIIRRIDPSENGSRMARNVLDKNHDDDPSVIEAAQHRLSTIAPGGAASVERGRIARTIDPDAWGEPRNFDHGISLKMRQAEAEHAADRVAALATSSPVDGEKVRHAQGDIAYVDGLQAHIDEGGNVSAKNVGDLIAMVRWSAGQLLYDGTSVANCLTDAAPFHIGNGGEGGAGERINVARAAYWADVKLDDHDGTIKDGWRDDWWQTEVESKLSGKQFLRRWLTIADAALAAARVQA